MNDETRRKMLDELADPEKAAEIVGAMIEGLQRMADFDALDTNGKVVFSVDEWVRPLANEIVQAAEAGDPYVCVEKMLDLVLVAGQTLQAAVNDYIRSEQVTEARLRPILESAMQAAEGNLGIYQRGEDGKIIPLNPDDGDDYRPGNYL